jgi:hypothetical protein
MSGSEDTGYSVVGFLTDKAKVKLAKPDKDKPGKEKTSKTEAKP